MKRLFILSIVLLAGCSTVISVPRYQVRDIDTGKTYLAEGPDLHQIAGGIRFQDEMTGDTYTLSHAETQRIDDAKYKAHQPLGSDNMVTDERIYPPPGNTSSH
jgi:hypothetical protein